MKISQIPFADLSFRLNTEFRVSRAEERDWILKRQREKRDTNTKECV